MTPWSITVPAGWTKTTEPASRATLYTGPNHQVVAVNYLESSVPAPDQPIGDVEQAIRRDADQHGFTVRSLKRTDTATTVVVDGVIEQRRDVVHVRAISGIDRAGYLHIVEARCTGDEPTCAPIVASVAFTGLDLQPVRSAEGSSLGYYTAAALLLVVAGIAFVYLRRQRRAT